MPAYLDPGAGSTIAAALAGGAAGVGVLWRVARERVRTKLRGGRGDGPEDLPQGPDPVDGDRASDLARDR